MSTYDNAVTLTCISCYLIGNYKVVNTEGNNRTAGTLPTELGNLKKWKHAVFGELILFSSILSIHIKFAH